MSQRMSLIGGSLSFAAVLVLSILSLEQAGDHGFFLMGLVTPEVEAPAVHEDSVDTPCPGGEGSEKEEGAKG